VTPARCTLGRALCSCRSCDPLNEAAAARAAAIDADRALDERNEAKREAYKRRLRAARRRSW
jgi:hypothetical protein